MSEEKEKKAATPRGRKKKEVKEEHISSIGPDSSPELVHEEIARAADVVSVKEASKEEGDWGTFSDRGAPVRGSAHRGTEERHRAGDNEDLRQVSGGGPGNNTASQ